MLLTSEIDAAIMTPPMNIEAYNNIDFYPLIRDRLVLVVHPDHPLAAKATINLCDMKDEKFILMNANNGIHTVALETCRNAGFEPNVVLQSRQVETVLGFVAAGLGSTLIAFRVAKFLEKSS